MRLKQGCHSRNSFLPMSQTSISQSLLKIEMGMFEEVTGVYGALQGKTPGPVQPHLSMRSRHRMRATRWWIS